ncbi:uncharacterized protein SCHCODRAFT_02180073 [Schizophyllum commune H4-8]|uniref:uncharacterized protein n=1 Tax=Schizophyllum commune (strain H4-8 / FGSC 9210) TaxID=578458 RepID=UPI002160E23B|nr:uncharacterized protein SCHCODRAFT_02180073 [Schizophyllum commune H4-8]KAI5836557.1 hypothetical protein SCHCODRAFT_02180073 [Schizophyllum commune H4-8]
MVAPKDEGGGRTRRGALRGGHGEGRWERGRKALEKGGETEKKKKSKKGDEKGPRHLLAGSFEAGERAGRGHVRAKRRWHEDVATFARDEGRRACTRRKRGRRGGA